MKNHKELITFILFIAVMSVSFYLFTYEEPQVRLRATPDLRDDRYQMKLKALEDEYARNLGNFTNL